MKRKKSLLDCVSTCGAKVFAKTGSICPRVPFDLCPKIWNSLGLRRESRHTSMRSIFEICSSRCIQDAQWTEIKICVIQVKRVHESVQACDISLSIAADPLPVSRLSLEK